MGTTFNISRERHSFIFIKVYGFAKCRLLKISFQKGLLILLETMLNELNKLFFNFIWDGKTEKN
jgi:hypothetical protein